MKMLAVEKQFILRKFQQNCSLSTVFTTIPQSSILIYVRAEIFSPVIQIFFITSYFKKVPLPGDSLFVFCLLVFWLLCSPIVLSWETQHEDNNMTLGATGKNLPT